ncbi:MAG: metallophosphoesterase [Natronomonas sp.]
MLVALADTHARESTNLEGRTREAVAEAETVIHAGDFTTEAVYEAFDSICDVRAVVGNNDRELLDRLPEERVVEHRGFRIGVVHGHRHSQTALSLFARQSNADLVVFGHSHRPEVRDEEIPLVNPGSHADPRRYRPGHAEMEVDGETLYGRLVDPSGNEHETFAVGRR